MVGSNHAVRAISERVRNRGQLSSFAMRFGLDLRTNHSSRLRGVHHRIGRPLPHVRCYGSKMKVELDRELLPGMEAMRPYLRSCASSEVEGVESMDMEFAVSFLGTGSGKPSMHRNSSGTVLRLGGQALLFDAGEGIGRQLEFTRIAPTSLTKIFISHLHGDHLYGLVPILLSANVAHKAALAEPTKKAKVKRVHGDKATVEIYGPPGLYNYVNMVLALSCSKVNYLNVHIIELVGGREEQGPGASWQQQRRRRGAGRNVFLSHYPEIDSPLIKRHYLQQNKDRVWVIDEPEPITKKTAESGAAHSYQDGFHRLPNDPNLSFGRRLHIRAAELDHLKGVQCFGYTVEEQPLPGTIDVEKATSLGVRPSKKYGLLKCGLSVPTDDGTGEVHPDQVLIRSFQPRKLALLADQRIVPPPMANLCQNADLLVHEATLTKEGGMDKVKMRGHSTAFNGGVLGRELGCKVLALNHFGSTSIGRDYVIERVDEAREGNQNASQIIAAHDFMEVRIPRGGFDFSGKVLVSQANRLKAKPSWVNRAGRE